MNAPVRDRQGPIPPAEIPAAAWRHDVKIRFSHCDPAGIVYFANYFDIANSVVEDWFAEALGFQYREFIVNRRIGLGFASAQCDFFKPGMIGDRVTFAVLVERIGTASIKLQVVASRDDESVLAMRLVMVTTSLTEHRAIPVPDDLRAAIASYQEKCT